MTVPEQLCDSTAVYTMLQRTLIHSSGLAGASLAPVLHPAHPTPNTCPLPLCCPPARGGGSFNCPVTLCSATWLPLASEMWVTVCHRWSQGLRGIICSFLLFHAAAFTIRQVLEGYRWSSPKPDPQRGAKLSWTTACSRAARLSPAQVSQCPADLQMQELV